MVFGSLSDSDAFAPVLEEFKKRRVPYVFHGLSAHKTPKELETELKKTPASIFIAGAGLAAALPGVVASQTIKPIIGVSVKKDFDGLDSLLSTMQMPPNVPVLTVGPQNPVNAARHAINFLNRYSGITLVDRKNRDTKEAMKKAMKMLKEFKVRYNSTFKTDYSRKTELYIDFVPFEQLKELKKTDATAIIVPIKKDSKARDAIELMNSMENHLWVGLNRVENAVLGAMQLMGFGASFEKKLLAFRQTTGQKVIDLDKEEFSKWNITKGGEKK